MMKNQSKVNAVFWGAEIFKLGNEDRHPCPASTGPHRDARVIRRNKILSQTVNVDG
jgi:hypothetical protein